MEGRSVSPSNIGFKFTRYSLLLILKNGYDIQISVTKFFEYMTFNIEIKKRKNRIK